MDDIVKEALKVQQALSRVKRAHWQASKHTHARARTSYLRTKGPSSVSSISGFTAFKRRESLCVRSTWVISLRYYLLSLSLSHSLSHAQSLYLSWKHSHNLHLPRLLCLTILVKPSSIDSRQPAMAESNRYRAWHGFSQPCRSQDLEWRNRCLCIFFPNTIPLEQPELRQRKWTSIRTDNNG